jgi:hypothetical protein
MAKWLLECRKCGQAFTYSLVPDIVFDFHLPSRPVFPAQGKERECPSCKTKATYQQADLRFQNESHPVR